MKWPPGNANAALAKRRREKLIDVAQAYHALNLIQAEVVWNDWLREATRLFAQYWRTADDRHLRAFAEHVRAMRSYGGPR